MQNYIINCDGGAIIMTKLKARDKHTYNTDSNIIVLDNIISEFNLEHLSYSDKVKIKMVIITVLRKCLEITSDNLLHKSKFFNRQDYIDSDTVKECIDECVTQSLDSIK